VFIGQPGSLLTSAAARCGTAFTLTERGAPALSGVAFSAEDALHEDGSLYTTDILHITGGEGTFAPDRSTPTSSWCGSDMSGETLHRFPRTAHGASGVRKMTGLADKEIGLWNHPQTVYGHHAEEESAHHRASRANPRSSSSKKDENFLPGVPFAPLRERLRHAKHAIQRAQARRGGKGLIFAPHIGAPPTASAGPG